MPEVKTQGIDERRSGEATKAPTGSISGAAPHGLGPGLEHSPDRISSEGPESGGSPQFVGCRKAETDTHRVMVARDGGGAMVAACADCGLGFYYDDDAWRMDA